MKKIAPLLLYLICFSGLYAQQSVSIHGPFTANGKYTGDGSQNLRLRMKITGDSATVAGLKQAGMPDTLVMSTKSSSKYSITTGKIGGDGKYSIRIVANTRSQSTSFDNNTTLKEQMVSLFGSAKSDEIPHYDSIEITPKEVLTDSIKKILIAAFQSIGGMQFSHKKLYIGDTVAMNVTMPLRFAMIEETITVAEIFKLTEIKDGLAYFDISMLVKFNAMSGAMADMNMHGSGNGHGNCVYDYQNMYFKTLDTDMDFSVPFAMTIEGHTLQGIALGDTRVLVNFSNQKSRE